MPVTFTVDPGTPIPIYRQIVDSVRRAILLSEVEEGESLPSVRALAEQLVINPNTVVHAYTELAVSGLIVALPGRGYFFTERRQTTTRAERRRKLRDAAESFAREVAFLDFPPDELVAAVEAALEPLLRNVEMS